MERPRAIGVLLQLRLLWLQAAAAVQPRPLPPRVARRHLYGGHCLQGICIALLPLLLLLLRLLRQLLL